MSTISTSNYTSKKEFADALKGAVEFRRYTVYKEDGSGLRTDGSWSADKSARGTTPCSTCTPEWPGTWRPMISKSL